MSTQQKLTNAIIKRRSELDMTTEELYTKAGLSKSTFFRKMSGVGEFTTADIDRIAAALDCTVQVLLTPNEENNNARAN